MRLSVPEIADISADRPGRIASPGILADWGDTVYDDSVLSRFVYSRWSAGSVNLNVSSHHAMSENESEFTARWRGQHTCIKLRAWLVCSALLLFGNVLPISVSVWLGFHWDNKELGPLLWFPALGLLGAGFGMGVICVQRWSERCTDKSYSLGSAYWRALIVTFLSIAISFNAYIVGFWLELFLIVLGAIPVCLLTAGLLNIIACVLKLKCRNHAS